MMRAVNSELLRAEAVILSDYGKGMLTGDIAQSVIVAAKAQVASLLDPASYEHLAVDVELEGEECVIGCAPQPEAVRH